MKVKNPVIMKEIELTEKEKEALQNAINIIDKLYNTIVYGIEEDVNCGCISKEKLYEIGEILEEILCADVLYIKKVCTEE